MSSMYSAKRAETNYLPNPTVMLDLFRPNKISSGLSTVVIIVANSELFELI